MGVTTTMNNVILALINIGFCGSEFVLMEKSVFGNFLISLKEGSEFLSATEITRETADKLAKNEYIGNRAVRWLEFEPPSPEENPQYIPSIDSPHFTTRAKLTQWEAIEEVREERQYQEDKWGTINEHPQSIPGYLVILRKELEEAEAGWMKNKQGRDSALHEIKQIAAVALACIEEHGGEGN